MDTISTEVQNAAGRMTGAELTAYVRKAYVVLDRLTPGRIQVTAIAKDETRDLFIEVVKQYMRETPWQGYLSFSGDFSAIIKHNVSGPWMKESVKETIKTTDNE